MVRLDDLFDLEDFYAAIEAGYVRQQQHPSLPLWIYNYSEKCQFDRVWTPVTRQCRGLIVEPDLYVAARPFPKFFNYGQPEAPALDPGEPCHVTDKLDGSLGIGYPDGKHWAVATRGSFASDQALHATTLMKTRYYDIDPQPGITPLWEIIYPANRIVVDYQNTDDLHLLGAVDIATGEILGPADDRLNWWYGPRTQIMPAATLKQALELPPRPGKEGIVIRFTSGTMVKVKQDDYVALHRIVTNLNAHAIWERLGAGETTGDICAQIPDDFHDFVCDVAGELGTELQFILDSARQEHDSILKQLPENWTRKDFALKASKSDYTAWLFMLLDNQDPGPRIWKTLKPPGDWKLLQASEDTA